MQLLMDADLHEFIAAYISCKSGRHLEIRIMPMFGYARVSTRYQSFNPQVAELMTAGCAKVYREKASGAKTDRAELAKVISKMESGDVLVVCASTGWRAPRGTC
jgi:hypothetical protein